MKRTLFLSILCMLWIVIAIKTIAVIQNHDLSVSAHYYGGMLENSWQGHFNVDLLIHSVLFACWILYREKSLVIGFILSMAVIYSGALFSLFYLIMVLIRSKGDADLFFKGHKLVSAYEMAAVDVEQTLQNA